MDPSASSAGLLTAVSAVGPQPCNPTSVSRRGGLPGPALGAFQATLTRVWRLPWYNSHKYHKETLWRLAVDGVGLVGSCHIRQPPPACPCGVVPAATPRMHYFWECAVAAAVVAALAGPLGRSPSRAELWLLQCPPGLQPPVWDVVALSALSAMELGRRRARRHALAVACAQAVGDFWGRLRCFVALGKVPPSWVEVSPVHPFLGCSADGRLILTA